MAIEKFRGKYIVGENASKYIDMDTIHDGCRMMRTAAEKLAMIYKKIDHLRDVCSRDALSVQGENLENRIEAYENQINDFSLYIEDLSNVIEDTTLRVFNRKQVILNEEAKRLDEQITYEKENGIR